jgi:(2Fe-2S) ferredoxin
MSYYQHHLFFCTNQREPGEMCCNNNGAQAMRDYCKERVKAAGDKIAGNVRVNSAGCLDRCDKGPVIVVYPEDVWYTYVDQEDIDEIVESHLINGKVVDRLLIDNQ